MTYQAQQMEISEVRAIVAQVVDEQPVPDEVVQAAHGTVQAMCKEAARYGLATVDVVGAVLHPVFLERKRGCDSPTCKARRSELEEKQLVYG